MIGIPKGNRMLKAKIDNVSLVFERLHHTEQELMSRQMKQADLFWDYDNNRMIQLGKSND